MAQTYSLLAPSGGQSILSRHGTTYTADANGLITGVPLGDLRDLITAGCVSLGAGPVTESAAFNGYAGPPQLVTAAGATQGAATKITTPYAVLTVCTASARGVVLPTPVTGLEVEFYSATTQGVKVYPPAGSKFSNAATNAAAVQPGFKAYTYRARNTLVWDVQKGA